MNFHLNRINPNQTQVFFHDGRFETLTNDEVEELLAQLGTAEISDNSGENLLD